MAAYGSGACARSESREGMARTVLNIDMGGGTAKFAVCRGGEIVDTAAINVGARLITVDERGRITRVEPAGQIIAEELDIPLEVGRALSKTRQRAMAELLADCLANVAERRPLGRLANRLMITDPLSFDGPFDAVSFSGGVSEYVYGNESRDFGDLGIPLGNAVRSRAYGIGAPIEQSEEQIRATVIGAGQYTLQVSGSTIFVSRPGLLPQRNLQVVAPVMPGIRYNGRHGVRIRATGVATARHRGGYRSDRPLYPVADGAVIRASEDARRGDCPSAAQDYRPTDAADAHLRHGHRRGGWNPPYQGAAARPRRGLD